MSELALQRIAESKKSKSPFLNLGNCKLKELPKELGECVWVKELNLNNQGITDLSPLATLHDLKWLFIGKTKVFDLSPLNGLQNLQILNASHTLISDISPLKNLKNLRMLDIRNTEVSNLLPLKGLKNLQQLSLASTKVKELSPVLDFIKNGMRVSWTTSRAFKNEVAIKDCPLTIPPPAIVKAGIGAILHYFRELKAAGEEKSLEAKLILIGEGQSGKTSLRTRLLKGAKAPLPTKADRTKGLDIEIEPYDFTVKTGERMRLNIFDFGGQDHYKPLHQFFYSYRSLYVLVTRNGDESNDFDFWLDTAQLFGGGSPLLVVNNLFGDVPSQFNRSRYGRFEAILKDSVDVNLDTLQKGWPEVKEHIEFWADQLPHVHEFIPKSWVSLRRTLQTLRHENIIPVNKFIKICALRENGSMDKFSALRCSAYLHDIGFCLHYQDDPVLSRYVIVKNEWATEAVYRVIDDEKIGLKSGRFDWDDLHRIWQPNTEDLADGSEFLYEDYQPELLALMQKFKLCYPLTNGSEFIAPTRLPMRPPAGYAWQPNNDLQLFVEYDYMPPGLLSRFIVSRFEDIAEHRLLVWRDGVVFQWKSVRAEAQLITHNGKKTIVFHTQGALDERRIFMTMLDDSLEKLHNETPGIKVERKIPCICHDCRKQGEPHLFKKSDLDRFKEKGWSSIQCLKSGEYMEVEKLLGNVFARDERGRVVAKHPNLKESTEPLRLFISYSKHDIRHIDNLLKHLSGLRGKVLSWHDGDLLPGEDWNEGIKVQLQEAEVILFLVTANSLETEYFEQMELPLVQQRVDAAECLIVPVIVDFCHWTDLYIARYKALPENGYPITDSAHWVNENQAWEKVVAGVRDLVTVFRR